MSETSIAEFKRLFTQFHLYEMSDLEVLQLAMVIDTLRCELHAQVCGNPKKFLELDQELNEFARELQEMATE